MLGFISLSLVINYLVSNNNFYYFIYNLIIVDFMKIQGY